MLAVYFFTGVQTLSSLDSTARQGKVHVVTKVFSRWTHLAYLNNAKLQNLARNRQIQRICAYRLCIKGCLLRQIQCLVIKPRWCLNPGLYGRLFICITFCVVKNPLAAPKGLSRLKLNPLTSPYYHTLLLCITICFVNYSSTTPTAVIQ